MVNITRFIGGRPFRHGEAFRDNIEKWKRSASRPPRRVARERRTLFDYPFKWIDASAPDHILARDIELRATAISQ